jgi:hypothetical protein
MKSMVGGDPPDGYPHNGIWVEDQAYGDDVIDNDADIEGNNIGVADNIQDNEMEDHNVGFVPHDEDNAMDVGHDVERQVLEAFDRGDTLHAATMASEPILESIEADEEDDRVDNMERLYEHATTPVYLDATCSILSATIIIMNMCAVFHVSNKFADELLQYLSLDLLP